jgi:hypothetical protein
MSASDDFDAVIKIGPDGSVFGLHQDWMHELGKADISRASYVEPTAAGQWQVTVLPCRFVREQEILGTYPARAEALAAERRFFHAKMDEGRC